MSEWIKDRKPTKEDAGPGGLVWTTYNGKTSPRCYDGVEEGTPWMRMIVPEPYVKPKRWKVAYDRWHKCWTVFDMRHITHITQLFKDTDAHREAAERIAAIYEEMLP